MKYTPVPNDQYTDKMAKRDKRVINKAIKEAMSNSTQNDHETHTACIGRIKKEGASSTCCYCDPHDGCTLGMKPPTQNDPYDEFITSLGLDFRKGLGAIIGFHQLGKILRVFNKQVSDENRNELADARKEVEKSDIDLLANELRWCQSDTAKGVFGMTIEQKQWFMNGLIQAITMLHRPKTKADWERIEATLREEEKHG